MYRSTPFGVLVMAAQSNLALAGERGRAAMASFPPSPPPKQAHCLWVASLERLNLPQKGGGRLLFILPPSFCTASDSFPTANDSILERGKPSLNSPRLLKNRKPPPFPSKEPLHRVTKTESKEEMIWGGQEENGGVCVTN